MVEYGLLGLFNNEHIGCEVCSNAKTEYMEAVTAHIEDAIVRKRAVVAHIVPATAHAKDIAFQIED